jgi:hypothetical protein
VKVDFLAIEFPVKRHDYGSRLFATGAVIQLVTDWMATKPALQGFRVQFGYDTPILSFDTRRDLIEAVHAYLYRVYTDGGTLRIFIR